MRSVSFAVAALLLASCGGETTDPLAATFPMGPKEVRAAIYQRFSDVLTPDDSHWPENAPEVTAELTVVKGTVVEVKGGKTPFDGKLLKLDPALVTTDADALPVDEVELFIGPASATGIDDPQVKSVAHAPVPATRKENAELTWTDEGMSVFAAAFNGKLAGQNGKQALSLFLKGRAVVTLVPGQQLPVSEAEQHVRLDIPVRFSP